MRNVKKQKKRPTCIDLFCGCGGFSLGFINAGFDVLLGLDSDHAALTTYAYNLGADDIRWVGELPNKRFQKDHWHGLNRPLLYGEDPNCGKIKAPNWALKELRKKRNHLPWKRTVKFVVCKDVQDVSGWDLLEMLDIDHVDCVIGSPPCISFSKLSKNFNKPHPADFLPFEFARLIIELQPTFWTMENVPQFATKKLASGIKIIDVFNNLVRHPIGVTAADVLGG